MGALSRFLTVGGAALLLMPASASATFPGRNGLIAFVGFTGGDTVYTIHPNGSHARQLRKGAVPSFSADGKTIVFADDSGISTMRLDGSHRRTVVAGNVGDPSFAPNGRTIVFQDRRYSSNGQIATVSARGTHLRLLTWSASNNVTPRYSPDGKLIVFDSSRSGQYELYRMNANGSHVRRLTHAPAGQRVAAPCFAPDGKTIVFDRETVNDLAPFHAELFSIRINGTHLHQLTHPRGKAADTAGCPSPDGKQIVFTRGTPTWTAIVTMNSNGTRLRQVLREPGVSLVSSGWQPIPRR